MVLPAKIFEVKEEADFGLMAMKLKDFREEERYRMEKGETISLVKEILDLKLKEDLVSGVFSVDFVRRRYYRRKLVEAAVTEEAPFWFRRFDGRTFLIVLAPSVARGVKKLLTSHVANKLSEILFIKRHAVVEVRISHETLRRLHESNPEATKLVWFDDVDIPGVEKLCLAGSALADTKLYHDYLEHGKIWYVVFEVQNRGIVVGITRSCVVTLFSKSTVDEFINYILEDLLTLIK
ncbi:MAG: hypothetical protein ACP5ER_02145 [Candidatus Bathyarchaeales archaeon]